MNKSILLGVILSLIFGCVCFISTENIYVTLVVFALTLLYFICVISPRFKKYKKMTNRFNYCNLFINNFIISLNIKNSIAGAFESVKNSMDDGFNEQLEDIKELKEEEKILYLRKYFGFHVYQLFSDVILTWLDQGGDILKLSNTVLEDCRGNQELIDSYKSSNKKIAVEFSLLWMFAIVIIFILRFVLNDFFKSIIKIPFYPYMVGAIFLLILISIEIFSQRMTNLRIRGWTNENR